MTSKLKNVERTGVFQNSNEFGNKWLTNYWAGYDLRSIQSGNSPHVDGHLRLKYNPADIYRSNFRREPGSFVWEAIPDLPPRVAQFGTVRYPWVNSFDDAANFAVLNARLAVDIRRKASDLRFNLGQALAERHQTINMVANTATSLAHAFLDIRHGRVPKLFKNITVDSTRKASNIWLQYQYGWRPLVSDLYGALISAFNRPATIEIEATVKSNENKDFSEVFTTSEGQFHYRGYASVQYRMKANVKALVIDHNVYPNRLGLNNPALLAWELLPYSFVVDWFLNVGDYLQALTGFHGLDILESCTTHTRSFWMWAVTEKTGSDLPPRFFVRKQGFATGTDVVIKRTLGIPALELPTLSANLSLTRFTSALALLRQAFSR